MKITMYSNFLNHHQLPFCEAMVARLGGGFTFVACEPVPGDRVAMGYADMSEAYPFVLRAYQGKRQYAQALQMARESDVVIAGSAPREFMDVRMASGQLTFRYAERLFKKGTWRRFIPTTRLKVFDGYTKYRRDGLYVLCASAYTASDLQLCGFPVEKCLRWGYFPEVPKQDLDILMHKKDHAVPRILWAGRLVGWKHAEHAVEVGRRLKADGYEFQLDIVGAGVGEHDLQDRIMAAGLGDCVHLLGSMLPAHVREHMESSNVFLFTSSSQEGWGAVLNESMSSGCAVVASHAIGAVPFLISQGENGLIYRYGDLDDLYLRTRRLLDDRRACRNMGSNAYRTLISLWNAPVAAARFIETAKALQDGRLPGYKDGPCSPAEVLRNDWFRS